MNKWNCCRMCLSVQNLNPIYALPEYHVMYSNVLFITTGVKVDINDTLPQQICTVCINFVNESYKFRKKCEETQKGLQNRLDNEIIIYDVKFESSNFKAENATSIDITDFLTEENEFNNYNDVGTQDDYTEFEEKQENPGVIDVFDSKNELKIVEISDESKNGRTEKSRRKVREKLVTDKEKVKEEIKCEYCHKILTSRLSLRNHYKIHTGFDVVCEHCGKKFITRRLLLMHCRAKHGYEKTDKCSYCDYKASNAEQVKIHERLHTGEKPYVCKECNAGFHRKSSYLQHIAIHLPEKTVKCDQCNAFFKSVTLMRIHKNRHRAAQYTFRCSVCGNSFARRRNVARHLVRIHGLQPQDEHIDRFKIS